MVNLMDEGWIPAQRNDGCVVSVSLRTALLEAESLRGLPFSTPTLFPAVLRQTLLPLWLQGLGVPRTAEEWRQRYERGRLDRQEHAQLAAYLDGEREAFDLFDAERPFAQTGGLQALTGETKSVALLIPSVATGNNVPLFTTFSEAHSPALTPAEAAQWLLHAHCWDTAAIKTGARGDDRAKGGKTSGNPTGPLGQYGVVVPEGASLYETLLFNTPILPDGLSSGDRPQWQAAESAGPGWTSRPARGLLDSLTWQSRRIRLLPHPAEDGTRVARVVVCAGDRLKGVLPEHEWHTLWHYTVKPKKDQPPLRPRRHRPDEHAWQGLTAILALQEDPDGDGPWTSRLLAQVGDLQASGYLAAEADMRVRTCGLVYGNKSAIVEDALADVLPLPTAALVADSRVRTAVLEAVRQTGQVARALNGISADLHRAEGADPLPRDKGQLPSLSFLHAVDGPMRRLLAGLQRDAADEGRIEQGMLAWEYVLDRLARETADQLLQEASPAAFLGRSDDKRTYREATASIRFKGALKAILTRAAEAREEDAEVRDEDDDNEGEA